MTAAQPPLVAVFLGTDHHRFDRLLAWVSSLQEEGLFRFHVQHGSTPLPPRLAGSPLLGPAAMADLLDHASAVVTHGGPGSIMDAREHGHLPVVVPRDPRHGEHVDDHQQRFVRFVARTGLVVAAYDESELASRLSLATLTGHGPKSAHHATPTLARFEVLVERLVHR
ncbi:glycosyl transferase family 28 [Nocardioides albidus]|uniref:Glycosyl transferase family 28 n=1 Tax=Nocardioides albidus TaxID=1517589 RepID=A0A5C4VKG4_9ACTN|nr:glycosyltransferase [Nocardioides albidus]TNM36343.1 glycosyl transferase family 28 [Nocardioides albidus]